MRFRKLLLSLLLCALGTSASATQPAPSSQPLCKEAVAHVAKTFTGVFAPDTRASHCRAGDFNGDGKPDVLMVVKVLVDKPPAAAGVRTLPTFGAETAGKGRRQFLALHSTAASAAPGWQAYEKVLLDGISPVLVLNHLDVGDDLQVVSPRSKEVRGLQAPARKMRGAGVYLTTEAVDALLYWDGKAYVFHEDPEGP
jgi:hypothetical protein